jgi:hypothetical protein
MQESVFQDSQETEDCGKGTRSGRVRPFVQAYSTGTTAALTPRNSTTFVLHLAESSHILKMERRIRTSLAELRQAVHPFLVSPILWTNTQKVAPF